MVHEWIGRSADELPTPLPCVDIPTMDANIAAMSAAIRGCGKGWRPHVKSHRCPELAHRLVDAGAFGVTCATLAEAEEMARAGIPDVLLAYPVVGEAKVGRVATLARDCEIVVACDHFAQVGPLGEACRREGSRCRVIVEVDIGMNRVGIRPGTDARDLARAIDEIEGLRLVGLMGYEGHLLRIPDPDEKRRRIEEAIGVLVHTRGLLERDGLDTTICSAGGTGSYPWTAACDGVTEIQAGGGMFGDPFYREDCGVVELQSALTVRTTVVSRPTLDRAVVDAGRKSISDVIRGPHVAGHPDATVVGLSAEHGILSLGPASRDLRIGDRIDLVVGYSDFTNVLHDEMCGVRDGVVEDVWRLGGGRP